MALDGQLDSFGKAYGTVSNLRLRGLARLYTWLSANRVEHREIE